MEHDDRTRAANLARLRKPRKAPLPSDQLQLAPTFAAYAQLQDMTCSILISLVKVLQLLEECPLPGDTRHEFLALRTALALDLDHYRDLRGQQSLNIAMQSLYAHLEARFCRFP